MRKENQNNAYPYKYSQTSLNYDRTEFKSIQYILRSISRSCRHSFRYPIYKLLSAISRIFLLNEVEAIFITHLIKQTDWDTCDSLITQNSQQIKDVICYSCEQSQYKDLVLYLLLVTYTIKFYMNQGIDELLEEAERLCPNFKIVFQNWTKKHARFTTKINPQTLNRVYQDLRLRIRYQEPDYQLLTEAILQISPAYNSDRGEKDKKTLREQDGIIDRERPSKKVKTEHELHFETPIFTSSRFQDMVGRNHGECSNLQVFGYIPKDNFEFSGSFFGSALVQMPLYQMREEEDNCQGINLGLQEGQSEQHINLIQPFPEIAQASIFSLKQGFSGDRYLTFQDNNNA